MGAGASARKAADVQGASDVELRHWAAQLSESQRQALQTALASNGTVDAAEASCEEMVAVAAQLSEAQRQVLVSALADAGPASGSQALAAPTAAVAEVALVAALVGGAPGSGMAVAGENEDCVDTDLAIELSKQEMMFLKMLRAKAERDKKRKMDKEERKAAELAQKKKAMEAAFDNEVDALNDLFDHKNVEPDCADEHGTTLLSEAAGGGAQDVVEMLVSLGCDVNSIGRYRRTPLWRAAYAGRADLIRILLRCGGDPREPDEQGAKPIDVASNAESKELLLCWDTSATERMVQAGAFARKQNAKAEEKEATQKSKRQVDELNESIEEASRKAQIARSELARTRKLLSDYRLQKVSLVEVGEIAKLAELEPLLEGAEIKMKMFESSVQEWNWKVSRAKLKLTDFQQAEKQKVEKKAGKVQGFRLEVKCEAMEDLDKILPHLTNELEVKDGFTTESGLELAKGDMVIKEAPFLHLTKREFTKKMLEQYGRELDAPVAEAAEGEAAKEDEPTVAEEKEPPFPMSLFFARGFNRIIDFKQLSEVLLKDVGDMRKSDGRWPLIIDPSGRSSKAIKYLECTVFPMTELVTLDPLRLRRALLKQMMHGGAVIVDLDNFDFPIDVIEDQFNKVERGLFSKLSDRSVLYSYLLQRRFKSLITKDLQQEFQECLFLDDALQNFVLGLITSIRNPDFEFAKQFFTISVKRSGDDDDDA